MYKYKFCSTYGYFCTSIGSITPTRDLNKYKFCSTYENFRISISWVTPAEDLYKYKFAISTSMCISLLYQFIKSMIFVTIICLL